MKHFCVDFMDIGEKMQPKKKALLKKNYSREKEKLLREPIQHGELWSKGELLPFPPEHQKPQGRAGILFFHVLLLQSPLVWG